MCQGVKDYADQQKRLLADIANYMQRNRALARQREEDELAQEADCNPSSVSLQTNAAEPNDVKVEVIPMAEILPRPDDTETKPQDAIDNISEKTEEDVEPVEEDKGPENSPRHRMNLTLELKTRCQMLESPDFVPESEMQAASPPPPPSDEVVTPGATPVRNKRRIMMDIPPSPMVSSQGRTVLVPVFEDPLSPSLDDMAPLTGKTCPTKSYDIMSALDADCVSSQAIGDCQMSTPTPSEMVSAATGSDGSVAASPNSDESSSLPSSPDGFFLSSPSEDDSTFSPRPFLSRSASLPGDVPPGRSSQHRKSSLKATRLKHRFQVSKTVLPHKPPLGRRVSGSHKAPTGVAADVPRHSQSEHSTVESTSSAFAMMLPLTTSFQSKAMTGESGSTGGSCSTGDDTSLKITKASCDSDVAASDSSPAVTSTTDEPSLLCADLPVQTTSEIDSLQATPVPPESVVKDLSATPETSVVPHLSAANGALPNSVQATPEAAAADAAVSLTLCEDPDNMSVKAAASSNTESENTDVETTDDFPAGRQLDSVDTSETSETLAESVPSEESREIPGLDLQSSPSQPSEMGHTETCKTSLCDANSVADAREPHETDDMPSSDKTLSHVSNGLKLGFPAQNRVIDLADLADDVRKLQLGNIAGNSGTSD